MINLLPIQEKRTLRKYAEVRFVVVVLAFVFMLVLVATVFLIPSYVATLAKHKLAKEQLAQLESTEGYKNDETLNDIIKDINARINTIALPAHDRSLMESIVIKLIEAKPASLRITKFSISQGETGQANVVVSGVSPERDTLLSFVKTLEETSGFTNVHLPISNYAQDKDIEFSITLTTTS